MCFRYLCSLLGAATHRQFLALLRYPHHSLHLFFCIDTATTEIYTLSLHDALPIWIEDRQIDRDLGRVEGARVLGVQMARVLLDRKSTRLNSSHANISYAVFCLKKKKNED